MVTREEYDRRTIRNDVAQSSDIPNLHMLQCVNRYTGPEITAAMVAASRSSLYTRRVTLMIDVRNPEVNEGEMNDVDVNGAAALIAAIFHMEGDGEEE